MSKRLIKRLTTACRKGDISKVIEYINEGDDPSADDNIAILEACTNFSIDIVKYLLNDERVDPSADANISLQRASRRGYTEIVRLLLTDSRVNPSCRDNLPIRYALKDKNFDIIKIIIQNERFKMSDDLVENKDIMNVMYQIRQEKLNELC